MKGRFDQLLLVTWGRCWTDEAIDRAVDQANNGNLPWVCQRCAGRVCDACGAPETMPMGADVMHDDGTVGHIALSPGSVRCSNPSCSSIA